MVSTTQPAPGSWQGEVRLGRFVAVAGQPASQVPSTRTGTWSVIGALVVAATIVSLLGALLLVLDPSSPSAAQTGLGSAAAAGTPASQQTEPQATAPAVTHDPKRAALMAAEAAEAVAELQNDYRVLATRYDPRPKGDLRQTPRPHWLRPTLVVGPDEVSTTREALAGYFTERADADSGTDRRLAPWYLLADDATAPVIEASVEVHGRFGSGFRWVTHSPYTPAGSSRIAVTWLAVAERGNQILMVVEADYDVATSAFSHLRRRPTSLGSRQRLRVEVAT